MKMKNILRIIIFLVLVGGTISCKKDDGASNEVVLRDRQEVYDEDILEIEAYLKDNYLELDANLNATVKKIDAGQTSIWDDTAYPVQFITVKNDVRTSNFTDGVSADVVDYKLYYIVLNEGGGVNPTHVDSVFTAYKGWNLSNEVFDQNNQGIWFTYPQTTAFDPLSISGYRQVLTKIKTEESSSLNGNGVVVHQNYGNVIVFIPSGLAYFNGVIGGASYSPLAFQIKLFYRKENDHDRDRIKSNNEDLNGDGDFYNDDSDGDKIPNFLDIDDDGDGVVTKTEIKKPIGESGILAYYPFNPIADDPSTTNIDETELKAIPSCSGDYTTPTRLRKHLDPSCQ
ncbi:MAG: hypothetical protein CMP76_14930 [Flavobacterium sp.]|nr:hypothetical protein [Flavobacterium sp.]|tara:strand:+ start:673 stop:1695 length:1023 start_codon:yes stop_codon:yes gene_type:complete